MSQQTITLKTLNDLRLDASGNSQCYFIAAYQRGYRWSPLQVTQLLEDIREFTQRRNPQPDEFYCLQPLVLKEAERKGYEVVDGQQRLTTILLILRHFNERLSEKFRQKLFTLDYETRPNLLAFLDQLNEESADENVDYFHLNHAVRTIEEWFATNDALVESIKDAFLNKTKVIWFQLDKSDNPVDAFTRLNVGKIPLTNDELIRALFLRRSGKDETEAESLQLRVAYEWDQLEKSLQSNAFWYFLSNQRGSTQNRIGFLFDLVARADGLSKEAEQDAYGIFYAFSQKLKAPEASLKKEWLKVKQTYLMLEEWFEDRVLYHMVGYLVSEGMDINAIRGLSINSTKSSFEETLRRVIFRLAIGSEAPENMDEESVREDIEERLENLKYGSHSAKLKSILLLFNLATLLQNRRSNLRFQFDSFKSENWDIEHVRSVADDKPDRHSDRVNWLKHCLGYLESQKAEESLRNDITEFLKLTQAEATHEIFDLLYDKVLVYFQENVDDQADHSIANLALLDESTNRSYKNAVFAVKRQRLLTLDQDGIFVPLCTRNVFLKCYSPQVDNVMFWSSADRDGYQKAITETLVSFFVGRMEEIE